MKEDKGNREFWLLLTVYVVLSILLFDPKLNTGGDNARYVILAESLSRFKGFLDLHLPGSPAHTQYPFGFPLLLVPFMWLFDKKFVILKLIPLLCGVGSFIFSYLLTKKIFRREWLLPVLVFVSTPILIEYNHWLFSEMPFIFFSLGSLYFLTRHREAKKYFYLGTFFAVYAYFIRSAGITLILGIALALAYKKDWKNLVIFAVIFLIPFALWQYRNSRIPQEWSYLQQLMSKDPYHPDAGTASALDLLNRIGSNFSLYLFSVLSLSLMPKVAGPLFAGLIGVVVFCGVVQALILRLKRLDFIDFYFLFALALLLVWPRVWSGDRFLLPVLPLVILYIFISARSLFEKLKFRYGLTVFAGLILVVNLFFIVPAIGSGYRTDYPIGWRHYFEVCRWAKANIPAAAVIMARKPEFVYLFSGRRSSLYSFTKDEGRLAGEISGVDFILFDGMFSQTIEFLLPIIRKQPERFPIVYQTARPECYLLKVLK